MSVVAAVALAFAAAQWLPKKYEASARLLVDDPLAYRTALASPGTVQQVATALGAVPEQLLQGVRVAINGESRVVRIVSTSSDPAYAAAVANAFLRAYERKNTTVLDEAVAPRSPASPDLAVVLAAGGLAGAVLGVVLVLLRRPAAPRRRVRSERDLAQALGVPVAAILPPRGEAAESARQQSDVLFDLAVRLKESSFGERNVLAVVGAGSKEGRSYVAARLAMTFADLGETTLLIDADLRGASQHEMFRVSNEQGLSAFLLGGARIKPEKARDNLWIMPAGKCSHDPLELLGGARMRTLLDEAAKRFRVVLIDTPAAARGPELERMIGLAGSALVVARHNRSLSAEVERLRVTLLRCSTRVVGSVLNRA